MAKTITIGRADDCIIQVDEQYRNVSAHHADVTISDTGIIYTDHSSNGSTVNGKAVAGRSVTIHRGDKIVMGGKYELPWALLDRHLLAGRATVSLGKQRTPATQEHSGAQGRSTVQMGKREPGDTPAHRLTEWTPRMGDARQEETEPTHRQMPHTDDEAKRWRMVAQIAIIVAVALGSILLGVMMAK